MQPRGETEDSRPKRVISAVDESVWFFERPDGRGAGQRKLPLDTPMTENTTSTTEESHPEPRTRRARTEDMAVSLRKTGGIYSVHSESGNTYRVDVALSECSCSDQQLTSTERCKHLRCVELEIRHRTVPTRDGRLPERRVADGGLDAGGIAEDAPDGRWVEGLIQEVDKHGRATGASYYRCRVCGREAMRRQDLENCCPLARR